MKTQKFAELFPERLIQRVKTIIESQANGYMKTIGIHTNCKLFQEVNDTNTMPMRKGIKANGILK